MELQLPDAQTAEKPYDRDAEHRLPDHLERLAKRVPHLVLQGLLQGRNDRDRRERDLTAAWERREKRRGQLSLELVL